MRNSEVRQNCFKLNFEDNLKQLYSTLVKGIQDYFFKYGQKRAVLGISGGLDSAICAVLLVDALGAENVYGISMPSVITPESSKNDAKNLAENLGINFIEMPIKSVIDNFCVETNKLFEQIDTHWKNRLSQSFTVDNIQARARAMFLWAVSNEYEKTLTIATSDKSEICMGYGTINGDLSGGFAPIADVPKTRLFALGRWLNKNRCKKNGIPNSILEKQPSAELAINPKTGKPLLAEEALMPYEFIDEIIYRIEFTNATKDRLLAETLFYQKKYNISETQKKEWVEKFYSRMNGASFKIKFLPTFVLTENNSMLKNF